MAADNLMNQEARASAAMLLTLFSWNIPDSKFFLRKLVRKCDLQNTGHLNNFSVLTLILSWKQNISVLSDDQINTVGVDDLVPWVTRPSVAMILTIWRIIRIHYTLMW